MTQTNFSDILDTPSSEVERPKPLPQGSYTCVITGMPVYDKSAKKQTPYVQFTLNVIGAGEDVDEEDLQAMGGFSGKTLRATYYLTEDAIWRLKDFLDHCGIEEGDSTLRQRVEATPGAQVIAHVKHRPSQDGTSIFAEIGNTAAVD